MKVGAGSKGFLAVIGLLALGLSLWGLRAQRSAGGSSSFATNSVLSSPLARESMSLLGPDLEGVYFGMTQPELQRVRPRAVRQARADEPGYFVLEEALPSKERVLYSVDSKSLTLTKLQVAGKLPSVEAIEGRVASMQSRFGAPTGVYDCPMVKGQLPTRRFVYQRNTLGVLDSYLLLGEVTAVTLYFAPLQVLRASLSLAQCAPTPPDRMARFPAVPLPSK